VARDLTAQEQVQVQQGLQAEALLANDAFQSVIQSLCLESMAQWADSKPAQEEDRERQYYFYQGLKAIEAELNGRVQAKDEIVRMLDAEDEDAD
jgi:hypothetical protein